MAWFDSIKYQTTKGFLEAEFELIINSLRINEVLSVSLIRMYYYLHYFQDGNFRSLSLFAPKSIVLRIQSSLFSDSKTK